jgi:hypothetical protein
LIAREARRRQLLGALACGALFAAPAAYLWGFTVDDALITARVASHLATGHGYRWNVDGPVVDAVTPLGFAPLLALFSGGDVLLTMHFAKWFGAVAGFVAALLLGANVACVEGSALRFAALAPLALSAPLAAWCVSGMETGLVVLLATVAVTVRGLVGAVAAGLAAALRPELIPYCVTLTLGLALVRADRSTGAAAPRVAILTAMAIVPAVMVAVTRFFVFGRAAPLAVYAKPSDAAHGLWYVAACVLWTGAPALVVARWSSRVAGSVATAILVASAAHGAALVLAGGDWMVLFRLFVPVLPGLFVAGAHIAARASPWLTCVRVAVASVVSGILLFDKGPASRHVGAQREALIEAASPVLRRSRTVAALDVGWVGAAFAGEVVDLAGVTDDRIAMLPGGHTSKRVTRALLERRGVDTLVVLTSAPPFPIPDGPRGERAVEERLLSEFARSELDLETFLELSGTRRGYVVLKLKNGPQ